MNRLDEIDKIEKFYEKSKQQFYIDRNKNIEEVKLFAEKVKELDPDLIDFEYEELDPEKLLPSLYAEEFNEEDYIRDRDKVLSIVKKFEDLQDKLITEAKELLEA